MPTAITPLERVRRLALALPETQETHTWDETQFRVRVKIFVFAGEESLTVKADPQERDALVADARFFVPAYVGNRGWVGLRLDRHSDWGEVNELIETSYRMIAPKRLAARLDPQAGPI